MKKNRKRKITAWLCTLAVCMSSTCVVHGQAGEDEAKTLRIGTLSSNDVFSVVTSQGAMGNLMFSGFNGAPFITKGEDGEPAPYFMKDWEFSEDGKEMTFTYPTDVIWHDGKPVTEEDIRFTIEYENQYVDYSPLFELVENIEFPESGKCRLTLNKSCGIGLLKSMQDIVFMIPMHVWDAHKENAEEYMGEDASIGCGPYKLADVDTDAQISYYEAMPDYFYGDIQVKKVSLHTYSDMNAALLALKNDEIDVYYDFFTPLPASIAPTIMSTENIEPGMVDISATYQVAFGANSYPGNDVEFRKAVGYILDWDIIAKSIGGDYCEAGTWGAIPPIREEFADSPKLTTDWEKAGEILDAANYKDIDGDGFRENSKGEPMDITVMPHYTKNSIELRLRLCELIVKNLNDFGIKSHIEEKGIANGEYTWPLIKSGEYDLAVTYTTSGKADFDTQYFYFLKAYEPTAFGHFEIPEMDEQVHNLLNSRTMEEYYTAVNHLQKLNETYAVGLPLAYEKVFYPYSTKNFTGWTSRTGTGVIHQGTWFELSEAS